MLPTHNMMIQVRNSEASMPLTIPLQMVCNTDDETLYRNIETNSQLDREWIAQCDPHDLDAIICGGGPSLTDSLDAIRTHEAAGGVIFALNGAAAFLHRHGIMPDYQVILDPRPETADLVGPAVEHLFASQCDPKCFWAAPAAKVWHLEIGDIEDHFPQRRREAGGYVMVGGAASVGVTATCLAFAMGFRTLHCYGYDSSRRAGDQHAYRQPMNDSEPICTVLFGGKEYECSLTMKLQAERFIGIARALKDAGCEIQVHGSGLLPDMYNVPRGPMTEWEKYDRLWSYREYRMHSPGEQVVETFIDVARPYGTVIDFGCGTGRAGLKLRDAGLSPILTDFTDNSRDPAAMALPFHRCDLTQPIELNAPFGFCTDVMEHIPTDDVPIVVRNIMTAARTVFFQISTIDDAFGDMIGQKLHLTVKRHVWWKELFEALGYVIRWENLGGIASMFLVERKD